MTAPSDYAPTHGVLAHREMAVQRLHANEPPDDWVGEARATKTPGGDYLVMFSGGQFHYHQAKRLELAKANDMLAYRSADSGRTWSGPTVAWEAPYNFRGFIPLIPRAPQGSQTLYAFGTELVHPDAPPMLFHLADGKTLAAFHHNRHTGTHFHARDRTELWVSTSSDDGRTWSEPRFVLANAIEKAPHRPENALGYSVSYVDAFPDQGELHLFISHQFRHLLYVRFDECLLHRLPTRAVSTEGP